MPIEFPAARSAYNELFEKNSFKGSDPVPFVGLINPFVTFPLQILKNKN